MHHYASGKIVDMHHGKQSVGMPCTMSKRTIYNDYPQYHEEQIAGKCTRSANDPVIRDGVIMANFI